MNNTDNRTPLPVCITITVEDDDILHPNTREQYVKALSELCSDIYKYFRITTSTALNIKLK